MFLNLGTDVAAAAQPANGGKSGTLAKVAAGGRVVIGHREASPPFSFLDDTGKPVGYSIDLCLRIVARMREELGQPNLEIGFVPVNSNTRTDALRQGVIDLECGSTTLTIGRMAQVDFLFQSYATGTKLMVKRSSGIREIENLAGKRLAVTRATTNEAAVRAVAPRLQPPPEIILVEDHDKGFALVRDGSADAYALDHVLHFGLIARSPDPAEFAVVGRFLSYDPYAIMIRRDDHDLRRLGNGVLAGLYRSGEIIRIHDKWFKPLGIERTPLLDAIFQALGVPE